MSWEALRSLKSLNCSLNTHKSLQSHKFSESSACGAWAVLQFPRLRHCLRSLLWGHHTDNYKLSLCQWSGSDWQGLTIDFSGSAPLNPPFPSFSCLLREKLVEMHVKKVHEKASSQVVPKMIHFLHSVHPIQAVFLYTFQNTGHDLGELFICIYGLLSKLWFSSVSLVQDWRDWISPRFEEIVFHNSTLLHRSWPRTWFRFR